MKKLTFLFFQYESEHVMFCEISYKIGSGVGFGGGQGGCERRIEVFMKIQTKNRGGAGGGGGVVGLVGGGSSRGGGLVGVGVDV